MKKKGQVAIEMMILIGFLLLSFAVLFITIQNNTSEQLRERAHIEIAEVATSIQQEIDLAHTSLPGYERTFRTPSTRYLGEYTLSISDSILFVESEDGTYVYSVTVKNVSGQVTRGENTIKNNNGTISLS